MNVANVTFPLGFHEIRVIIFVRYLQNTSLSLYYSSQQPCGTLGVHKTPKCRAFAPGPSPICLIYRGLFLLALFCNAAKYTSSYWCECCLHIVMCACFFWQNKKRHEGRGELRADGLRWTPAGMLCWRACIFQRTWRVSQYYFMSQWKYMFSSLCDCVLRFSLPWCYC